MPQPALDLCDQDHADADAQDVVRGRRSPHREVVFRRDKGYGEGGRSAFEAEAVDLDVLTRGERAFGLLAELHHRGGHRVPRQALVVHPEQALIVGRRRTVIEQEKPCILDLAAEDLLDDLEEHVLQLVHRDDAADGVRLLALGKKLGLGARLQAVEEDGLVRVEGLVDEDVVPDQHAELPVHGEDAQHALGHGLLAGLDRLVEGRLPARQ
mmetsp:Transcript_92969/g.289355  ORF Transcript_92969/g.289355 Transcript_92969/m.289355 type:complete len:211 (+) Transcript_92969:81-713(+)